VNADDQRSIEARSPADHDVERDHPIMGQSRLGQPIGIGGNHSILVGHSHPTKTVKFRFIDGLSHRVVKDPGGTQLHERSVFGPADRNHCASHLSRSAPVDTDLMGCLQRRGDVFHVVFDNWCFNVLGVVGSEPLAVEPLVGVRLASIIQTVASTVEESGEES